MKRKIRRIKGTLLLKDDYESVRVAARIIEKGGLVAFPTETVYGLGADATNPKAVEKIFHAKGRPSDNPLIVHLSDPEQVKLVSGTISEAAACLVNYFWPGPLSLVLPRSDIIPPIVSAGLSTVAVRMPAHPAAIKLLKLSGKPIAAPSANRSGSPSPTSYQDVLEDLAGSIDAVIASDACSIGLESTVLDLSGDVPIILRPGGISKEELERVLGTRVITSGYNQSSAVPPSPGMKYRHYAPIAPLILVVGSKVRRKLLVMAIKRHFQYHNMKVRFLNQYIKNKYLCNSDDPEQLAAYLYSALRQMDREGIDLILAEEIDMPGIGFAVMNRLRKAALRILRVM